MPFTMDDAEKHKKGMTEKQKKQWMRISESVRKREMKKGMSEKEAAASAIKQANGVVGNNMGTEKYSSYKKKQDADYDVEIKIHQQKPYLVVPVTMIVEGVMNGSHGPLLHKKGEFGKFPASWNGIPVVIDHPEEDGMSVSANDPMIIDKQAVGRVYNTTLENNKLRGELWLDEEKLNCVNENIYIDINDNKMLEVSVGVFSEEEEEEGEYDGVKYDAIARNHHPDHLAILTQWKGACSCEDGCGIRANKAKEEIEDIQHPQATEEAGVEQAVNSGLTRTKFNINNKNDKKMAKNECPKCLEKINAVIANKDSGFIETDREWLETLSETALDKTITPKVKEVEKIVEKTIEVNKLTDKQKAALAFGEKQLAERRESWVKGIQANTSKVWTDEKLNVMDDDTLEGIFKSVKKDEVADYSLNGGHPINTNAGGVEGLYPDFVEFKK